MMLAVGALLVVGLIVLGGKKPKATSSNLGGGGAPPTAPAATGGVDAGKIAGAVGAVVSLGGTVLGALGGGGAASGTAVAGGATAATSGGATLASGGTTVGGTSSTAGGVAGGAAGSSAATDAALATVSGVSTGLEALAASSPLIIAAVAVMVGIMVSEAIAQARLWWDKRSNNKRRLYFARWFLAEEKAVQDFITAISARRSAGSGGGAVPHTMEYANTIDNVDAGGFEVYGYFVDTVSDAEVAGALPYVRALARWHAVTRDIYHNACLDNFFTSLEARPLPASEASGLWNQYGQNPGMRQEDFVRLVEDYLLSQPFAKTWSTYSATQFGDGSGGATIGGASSFSTQAATEVRHSYQPHGLLPWRSYKELTEIASRIQGKSWGAFYGAAEELGRCSGMTLAAEIGYSFAWPGDESFAKELVYRTGTTWPVHLCVNAANERRWCAVNPNTYDAFDVIRSREQKATIIYRLGDTYAGVAG